MAPHHAGQRQLAHADGRVEVQAHRRLQLGHARVVPGGPGAAAQVVDQDLDLPQAPLGSFERVAAAILLGEIGGDRDAAHLRLGGAQMLLSPSDQRDAGALRRQRASDGDPDSAAGAGDQRGAAGDT